MRRRQDGRYGRGDAQAGEGPLHLCGRQGVELTNNVAERRIRPAVIYRKLSFGTHSEDGSRFIERMMTVTATLKQQNRNVLEYLTAAYAAHLAGAPAPSLLPTSIM